MGCHYSRVKENRSTKVNVGVPTLFSDHKNITEWEKEDYKKRTTNNLRFINRLSSCKSL